MKLPHLLLIVLLVAAAVPAAALGGKLGVQGATIGNSLTGDLPDEGSWGGGSSFGFGLVAELYVAKDIAISFQPGVAPRNSQQIFKEKGEVVAEYDYGINYLSLPLIVRVTGDPVGTRGFVTAGLDLNILLDATINVGEGEVDITDAYQPTTMGALFGAGVMIPLGRNMLTFELRYEQGLSDIVERDTEETETGLESPSVKFRGISLIAGFLFSLGGE